MVLEIGTILADRDPETTRKSLSKIRIIAFSNSEEELIPKPYGLYCSSFEKIFLIDETRLIQVMKFRGNLKF